MIRTEANGIAANAAPISDFPALITAAWRSSIDGIIEAGRLLSEAKAALPHGAFEAMIESELPFSARTAQRLMTIAKDERLANPTHVSQLPPSWGTLYELTKLPDDEFAAKMADGSINPEMQRKDVAIKATKAPKEGTMNDEIVPPVKQHSSGPRINIPEGMTAETLTRKGIALEAEGFSSEEVAGELGVAIVSYRRMRDIVLVSDHKGLTEHDTEIAARALAMLNEVERVQIAWPLIEPITVKLWGTGSFPGLPAAREAKRLERFEHSFGIIMQSCVTTDELDIPYLSADRAKTAVKQINAARRALSDLLNRIKGVHE